MARGLGRIAGLWEAVRSAGEENVGFCRDAGAPPSVGFQSVVA